jgi:acetyltransferase-like isoleucine patch superfamily enzyme
VLYDKRFFEHIMQLSEGQGRASPKAIRIAYLLVSKRFFSAPINAIEWAIGFIISLPIPFYADLMLFVVTYLQGSPHFLGNYLRGIYWKGKLKKMAMNCVIEQGVVIRFPEHMVLDEFVLIDKNVLMETKYTKIGQRVHIAENCVISGGGEFEMEPYSCVAQSSAVVTATDTPNDGFRGSGPMAPWEQRKVVFGKVHIKKDAFVGMGARILPNVTIGEGAVVAAGAVVNRDIPPWQIVAGVPARAKGVREKVKFPDL